MKDLILKYYGLKVGEEIEVTDDEKLTLFITYDTSYDFYCEKCEKEKTFDNLSLYKPLIVSQTHDFISYNLYEAEIKNNELKYKYKLDSKKFKKEFLFDDCILYVLKEFECPYCRNRIIMFYKYFNKKVKKLYQSYDYNQTYNELKKYKKNNIIDDKDLKEIEKAFNCKSQGMSVASFVYLRRVFENMIDKIYKREKKNITLKEKDSDFSKLIIKDKLKYLDKYLPILIDGNITKSKYNELYKLLSEGIHKLDEKTCESLFDLLSKLILIILEKEESKKIEQAYIKQLSQSYNEIFNKNI